MKLYVLGFLFTNDGFVWLIRKKKPSWQFGKLNGIGGKIEEGESPSDAMTREFKEEAGLTITDWRLFCNLGDESTYQIYCYFSFSEKVAETITEEKVSKQYSKSLPEDVIPNLKWLIPMAQSFTRGETVKKFMVKEII